MISLERCQEIADNISTEYNYPRCEVRFSRKLRNTWAYIRSHLQIIVLNFNLIQTNPDENMIRDLLKHEFAHIGIARHGHDEVFKQACDKMQIPRHTCERHKIKEVDTYLYVCKKCGHTVESMVKFPRFCSVCDDDRLMKCHENPNVTKVKSLNIRRRQIRNGSTKF